MPFKKDLPNRIEIPDFLASNHIPSLDGIRAFSILIVIIGHINVGLKSRILSSIFGYGTLGVQFFFVLSGILITTLLLREKLSTGNINLKRFYIRRALRIIPVATLFILVMLIVNFVFNLRMPLSGFLYPVSYTENLNPSSSFYTGHFWSLSIEEQFYLIFPFILKKSIRNYLIVSVIIIVSSPLIVFIKYHLPSENAYLQTFLYYLNSTINRGLISILIGSVFVIMLFKYPITLKIHLKYINLIQAVLLILIWLSYTFKLIPGGMVTIVVPGLICILIFTLIKYPTSVLFKFLNYRFVTFIGTLSYSIYIWQQLFTNKHPWNGYSHFTDTIIFNIFCLFIVAYLSYNYFEKYFLLLKRKLNI